MGRVIDRTKAAKLCEMFSEEQEIFIEEKD